MSSSILIDIVETEEALTWRFRGEPCWWHEYFDAGTSSEAKLRQVHDHARSVLDLRAAEDAKIHTAACAAECRLYRAAQREERPPYLSAQAKERASAEWSAQLRIQVEAQKERDTEAARYTPYWSPEEQSGGDL